MCGILLLLGSIPSLSVARLLTLIQYRGPDSLNTLSRGSVHLSVSVLHIRGENIVSQPLATESLWFAWNGEAYAERWTESVNDTEELFREMETGRPLESLLRSVTGPYAFVLVNWKQGFAYFGRDLFGQRSLLLSKTDIGLVLCSCSDGSGPWEEVRPGGIHRVNLSTLELDFVPWEDPALCVPSLQRFPAVERLERREEDPVEIVRLALFRSVEKLAKHEQIAVLFSGGLDSTLLAAVVAGLSNTPETIYLINVSFSSDSPDRLTAVYSYKQLQMLYPMKRFKLICVDPLTDEIVPVLQELKELIYPKNEQMDLSITSALWFAAAGKGKVAMSQFEGEQLETPDLFAENERKELKSGSDLLGKKRGISSVREALFPIETGSVQRFRSSDQRPTRFILPLSNIHRRDVSW